MLTEVKLRELIRKAESATPGPWAVNPQERVNVQDRAQNPHTLAICSGLNDLADHQEANAEYIAAANPVVVSELVRACLEMREVLKFYGGMEFEVRPNQLVQESTGGRSKCWAYAERGGRNACSLGAREALQRRGEQAIKGDCGTEGLRCVILAMSNNRRQEFEIALVWE